MSFIVTMLACVGWNLGEEFDPPSDPSYEAHSSNDFGRPEDRISPQAASASEAHQQENTADALKKAA